MRYSAAFNIQHGKPFSMMWPPINPDQKPPVSLVPQTELQLDLPSLELGKWEDLGKNTTYFDSSVPEAQQMPLLPHRSNPLLADNLYRSSQMCRMQLYYSLGSKEGVIWLTSWIRPDMPKPAPWSYLPERSTGSWFPALERTRNERLQSSTIRIPYWAILPAYALCWFAFLTWRGRRLRKRLTLMEGPPLSS